MLRALLETLDGTYDGYVMPGTEISAGQDGVIGSISVSAGNSAEKGSVAAEIYPMDRMRVEATVPEAYVGKIQEGDEVTIFGDANLLQQIARTADTIPYEILTSVSPRVRRIYYQE